MDRRMEEIDSGKVPGIPAEEVHKEIREMLKNMRTWCNRFIHKKQEMNLKMLLNGMKKAAMEEKADCMG